MQGATCQKLGPDLHEILSKILCGADPTLPIGSSLRIGDVSSFFDLAT